MTDSSSQKIESDISRSKDEKLHLGSDHENDCAATTDKKTAADNAETLVNIPEMVSEDAKEPLEEETNDDKCCTKTKKQRQALVTQTQDTISLNEDDSSCPSTTEALNLTTTFSTVTDEKSPFQEVEIKLEEMFAGIEDERPTTLSKANVPATNVIENKCAITPDKPVLTKAAIKATEPIPLAHVDAVGETSMPKSATNRRRLSMVGPPQLPADKLDALCNNKFLRDKVEQLSMQNDSIVHTNNDCHENSNLLKKNKNMAKKVKGHRDAKKGKTQNSKQKKKTFVKHEDPYVGKHKGVKIKSRRTQNSSSSDSENDQDERAQQTIDTKYRSPYILIKHDGSVSVVNAPTADDCNDKSNKSKRTGSYVMERRNVRGIYSSTLSNKYDADTADSTWICVFCSRGPHKKGLGDLFGPYIINIDPEENKKRPDIKNSDAVAGYHKRRKVETPLQNNIPSPTGGHRKYNAEDPCALANNIHGHFEIWFHEDCAVWAPNLYIVGSRLVGLESAVSQCTSQICAYCLKTGAIVCCLQRECKETSHVPCARENNWFLDETKFWAYCGKHIPKYNCLRINDNSLPYLSNNI